MIEWIDIILCLKTHSLILILLFETIHHSLGDCGHILKTIAYRRRHPGVSSISLYVYEKEPEAVARLLLLLYISQVAPQVLGAYEFYVLLLKTQLQ